MRLATAALLAMLCLSGCATKNYEFRKKPGKELTYDQVDRRYKLQVDKVDGRVEKMVRLLENVPDAVQRISNRRGQILITDDGICEVPGFEIPEKYCDRMGYTMATMNPFSVNAIARKERRKLFGLVRDDPYSELYILMHEDGHATDFTAGEVSGFPGIPLSSRSDFQELCKKLKAEGIFPADHPPIEMFAELYAFYYMGGRAKNWLRRTSPEVYNFLYWFERDAAAGKYDINTKVADKDN